MNHMTAVTQTEAFSNLDEGVMKNFIIRAAQSGAFKYWLNGQIDGLSLDEDILDIIKSSQDQI